MGAAADEKAFQDTIVDTLQLFGYAGCHVYPLMDRHGVYRTPTTAPGWPDLVYLRQPRLLAIEVKVDGPSVPKLQRAWLTLFSLIPCARAWVIRPSRPEHYDTVVEWIRRPAVAPQQFGFTPVEDPFAVIAAHRPRKRNRS
jgi:hypothetical protein